MIIIKKFSIFVILTLIFSLCFGGYSFNFTKSVLADENKILAKEDNTSSITYYTDKEILSEFKNDKGKLFKFNKKNFNDKISTQSAITWIDYDYLFKGNNNKSNVDYINNLLDNNTKIVIIKNNLTVKDVIKLLHLNTIPYEFQHSTSIYVKAIKVEKAYNNYIFTNICDGADIKSEKESLNGLIHGSITNTAANTYKQLKKNKTIINDKTFFVKNLAFAESPLSSGDFSVWNICPTSINHTTSYCDLTGYLMSYNKNPNGSGQYVYLNLGCFDIYPKYNWCVDYLWTWMNTSSIGKISDFKPRPTTLSSGSHTLTLSYPYAVSWPIELDVKERIQLDSGGVNYNYFQLKTDSTLLGIHLIGNGNFSVYQGMEYVQYASSHSAYFKYSADLYLRSGDSYLNKTWESDYCGYNY